MDEARFRAGRELIAVAEASGRLVAFAAQRGIFVAPTRLFGRDSLRQSMDESSDRCRLRHGVQSMRASVVVLAVASLLSASHAGAQRGTAAADEALRAAEAARRVALLRGDTVALARMTAPEFYEVNRFGVVRSRSTNLQEVASGTLKLLTITYDSITVHAYGDVAVLTVIADNTGEYRGTPFSGRIRYTRVFVRRDGRWQAVAMQHTPMP